MRRTRRGRESGPGTRSRSTATAGGRAPRRGGSRLLRVLGVLGLVPPFALAFYSLSQPWARGRFMVVGGITRSPGAALLLVGGLSVALAAGITVAWSGRWPRVAAGVHLVTGLVLGAISYGAYAMVRDAGVRALFVPIASVRPGRGLFCFAAAAGLLGLLGLSELAVTQLLGRRRAAGPIAARPAGPSAE